MRAVLFGQQSNFNKVTDFLFLRLDIDYISRIIYIEKIYLNGYRKNELRIFSKNEKEIVILISYNKFDYNLIKQTFELLKRKYNFSETENIINYGNFIQKEIILKEKEKQEPEFI